MDLLKLVAFDKDDLETISALLQDAITCVAQIVWLPAEKRVVIGVNRFDWTGVQEASGQYQRRHAALRFERVHSFKSRGIDPVARAITLNLLRIEFDEGHAPGGVVTLTFSGDHAIRLEVECIETELADLGSARPTVRRPEHQSDPA
jgi:hypothetical protein